MLYSLQIIIDSIENLGTVTNILLIYGAIYLIEGILLFLGIIYRIKSNEEIAIPMVSE